MDNTDDTVFIRYGFNKPDFRFNEMNNKYELYKEENIKIIEDFINSKNSKYNIKSECIDVFIFPSFILIYNRIEDIRIIGTGLSGFVTISGYSDYDNVPEYLKRPEYLDIIKKDLTELANLLGVEITEIKIVSPNKLLQIYTVKDN